MANTLEYAEQAIFDLDDIWAFAAKVNLENADRITQSLQEAIKLLLDFPYMGRARDEWQVGLRALTHDRYMIIYRVENDSVIIQRVVYASRDIKGLFRDE
jgi:toxin ParE1/3/4